MHLLVEQRLPRLKQLAGQVRFYNTQLGGAGICIWKPPPFVFNGKTRLLAFRLHNSSFMLKYTVPISVKWWTRGLIVYEGNTRRAWLAFTRYKGDISVEYIHLIFRWVIITKHSLKLVCYASIMNCFCGFIKTCSHHRTGFHSQLKSLYRQVVAFLSTAVSKLQLPHRETSKSSNTTNTDLIALKFVPKSNVGGRQQRRSEWPVLPGVEKET